MSVRIAKIPIALAPRVKAIKRRKSVLSVLMLSLLTPRVLGHSVRILLTWAWCDWSYESRATFCIRLSASLRRLPSGDQLSLSVRHFGGTRINLNIVKESPRARATYARAS
jgi:hypothetical protein